MLHLAWRYIVFHKAKTAIVIACVTLTAYLPVTAHLMVERLQRGLTARAEATPLVIGAKGSRFDLALHALYFRDVPPEETSLAESHRVRDSGLAEPIPLFIRYTARKHPIVGTTLDYFEFRRMNIAEGQQMAILGDCVIGHRAAKKLEIKPGDHLLSDPENLFDIAGSYPLRMKVTGILAPTFSADDDAIFVDMKTAWIIAGVGHGHQDLTKTNEPGVVLSQTDQKITASAAVVQFTEITDKNIDSFHFHGSPDQYPLTALIALPHDRKSSTILEGRYLAPKLQTQIIDPEEVVNELMRVVFRVKRFFDLGALVLLCVTLVLIVLVMMLALRLRQREMETMFKLGCGQFTIFGLQAAELAIVIVIGLSLAAGLTAATLALAPRFLQVLA